MLNLKASFIVLPYILFDYRARLTRLVVHDADLYALFFGEADGIGVEHTGPVEGQLVHFVKVQHLVLLRLDVFVRVGGLDAVHILDHFHVVGPQLGGQKDSGYITPAAF